MASRTQLITNAAKFAGQAILKINPEQGLSIKEGRGNFVTKADLASQKIIIDLIKNNFPDDTILSEETHSDLENILEVEKLWVIDPIDGTNNFRFERNYSAISIAFVEMGKVTLAAIYDPFRDEMFSAVSGQGAFLNGKKIKVSKQNDLSKANVCTDNRYEPAGTRRNLELLLKIDPSPWVTMKGCASLVMCEVACGRADLYFQTGLKPWDSAAGFLIVTEAGGIVTSLNGEDISFLSPEIILGNKKLVQECVRVFSR